MGGERVSPESKFCADFIPHKSSSDEDGEQPIDVGLGIQRFIGLGAVRLKEKPQHCRSSGSF